MTQKSKFILIVLCLTVIMAILLYDRNVKINQLNELLKKAGPDVSIMTRQLILFDTRKDLSDSMIKLLLREDRDSHKADIEKLNQMIQKIDERLNDLESIIKR